MIEAIAGQPLCIAFDEKKIDAIFAQVNQCHSPGAAVGIALGGKPVYRKGFGLASMELPVLLSSTVRMRVASVTKHFTCLAYMLLCEEGKASVDDTVGKHLPQLHPVVHGITMRQLMCHVSGLRDAHDICNQFSGTGRHVTTSDLLALYREIDDVNATPGVTWNYNNGGYLILSAVIEKLTGQSLEEVLEQRVFKPIGMNDTRLRRFDTDFLPNSATQHMIDGRGGFEKSYIGTASAGEGGMVSTVDDLLRWLAHMSAPIVGNASTWRLMKAPNTLANGTSTGYGLGLVTGQYRGMETLSHSGSLMGCNSHIVKVPAAELDIVVLVNRHDVMSIWYANEIIDAYLPPLDPMEKNDENPFSTGIFRSPKTGRVIQLLVKDGQQIASIDGLDMPFESNGPGVLRPLSWLSLYKVSLSLSGDCEAPAAIQFNEFGNVDELIAAPPAESGDAGSIVGRYRSEITGTEATISVADERPVLRTVGRFGSALFELECLAIDLWRAQAAGPMPWGGILIFDRGRKGFRFNSSRTWALSFRLVE
jgi:CubicO group peptidase (beta-lactamase class C family)